MPPVRPARAPTSRPAARPAVKPAGKPTPKEKAVEAKTTGKGADDALSFADTPLTVMPALAAYTNLHKLNLSNCGLTKIGWVKEAKATLTWLKVEGNDLSGEGAWDGIEELSRLFVLNASNCKLTSVPSVIEALYMLKALVLSNNLLKELEHVKGLPDLNTLVVSNNALTSLPANLVTLGGLKKISAAHNQLTAASLPDLSLLSQLREIKFNDNPTLVSLPSHLSAWGKGSLSHLAEFKGRRPLGLEIVDLGNCGFLEWYDLAPLAGQPGVVNLVLKGTKISEEALEDGFEDYKSKITILLPALRILDGQRFDAKFFDLREKRLARPAPVPAIEEEAAPLVEAPVASTSKVTLASEPDEPRKKKRKAERVEAVEETAESAIASAVSVEGVPVETTTKKRKKNRHEARRTAEATDTAALETTDALIPSSATPALDTKATPAPTKRKAKAPKASTSTAKEPVVAERKKRDKRGVLGALRGNDDEERAVSEARTAAFEPTGANATIAPTAADEQLSQKAKTSVLGVVVVKKDKEHKAPMDLGSLLGAGTVAVSGWD